MSVRTLPDALQSLADEKIIQLSDAVGHALAERDDIASSHFDSWVQTLSVSYTGFLQQLTTAITISDYVCQQWTRHPNTLIDLVNDDQLYSLSILHDDLSQQVSIAGDENTLKKIVRQYRHRVMTAIIFQDVNRLAGDEQAVFQQTASNVSQLAAVCIDVVLNYLHDQLKQQYGKPVNSDGAEQFLSVIAMGKFGGNELNLSSDVDLMFVYPESGETVDGTRSISNQEFFTYLGQRLIQCLDQVTADGFAFRVDMRLRPYGESGALVANFDAMELYYQTQGRDWERYAMIKARIVAGNLEEGNQLLNDLRPFVYRRYLDFSAIDSLRSMKALIQREVKKQGKTNNIKLSSGGIRECEFILQSLQLIYGGKQPSLQVRPFLQTLKNLTELDYLSQADADELKQAYIFLRNTEHAIQAYQDKQTQALPDKPIPQAILAYAMGFYSWEDFLRQLTLYQSQVENQFAALIEPPSSDDGETQTAVSTEYITQWWQKTIDDEWLEEYLQSFGFQNLPQHKAHLLALRDSSTARKMDAASIERLLTFLPLLFQACSQTAQPDDALQRFYLLIENVLRRTAYLVLLIENPQSLATLAELSSLSQSVMQQVARHPILLDELLDAEQLYTPLNKHELVKELRQQLLTLPEDDLEAQMRVLRYFKLSHALRVSVAELKGRLPLMKVSDYLTYIAEAILEQVLHIAWRDLTQKHGTPTDSFDTRFVIVGYGKAGGLELGHGSDLDLVFIHNVPANAETNGDKPIDASVFYNRLGQRIIHIMTTQTAMGRLYEVDMRLRPSGNSGLLVSSLVAFKKYQELQAWTWEHQALVRARVLAGDDTLAQEFNDVRQAILATRRDEASLRKDVIEMRHKMFDNLSPDAKNPQQSPIFHLKHSRGGIIDIEFMVQYAVLAWSADYPALAHYTDNIRILETLANSDLLAQPQVNQLIDTYIAYREQSHKLALQDQDYAVDVQHFVQQREEVSALWQQLFQQT